MTIDLYKKMLRGECSPEETEQVMQWLQEAPEMLDAAMLQEISVLQEEGKMPAHTRQQMLAFFASKGIPVASQAPAVVISVVRRKLSRWVAAAAILVLMATGWLTYTMLKPGELSTAWLQIQNKENTIQLVSLPDSSQVWLHAGATLRYREHFNRHAERTVLLNGEAYFKVAQQALHPFVVQAGELNTQVLGTAFNVEAYADESFIKVTLQEGKVQVTNHSQQDSIQLRALLQPGQMAVYSKSDARLVVARSTIKEAAAWTGEGLVLNDVPLPDALHRIARKYNNILQFDSLQARRHQHVTARYEQMDIEQVLTQLGFTCGFRAIKTAKGGYRIVWE